MLERTVACPICREPYKTMAYYCGDQSACPECVGKAERRMLKGRARPQTLAELHRQLWPKDHLGADPADVTARTRAMGGA